LLDSVLQATARLTNDYAATEFQCRLMAVIFLLPTSDAFLASGGGICNFCYRLLWRNRSFAATGSARRGQQWFSISCPKSTKSAWRLTRLCGRTPEDSRREALANRAGTDRLWREAAAARRHNAGADADRQGRRLMNPHLFGLHPPPSSCAISTS